MQVLAIETSERVGTLALLQASETGTSVVRTAQLPSDRRSAQSLVPAIKQLLNQSGWNLQQLDLICVTTGPGSFTGLRIGVTTAKTLAYAMAIELVEVHTLAAMVGGVGVGLATGVATATTTPWKRLWTILDAQRQELFVATFGPHWQADELPPTRILGVQQWLQELRPGDVVTGPPLRKLSDQLPADVLRADVADWSPRAEFVGQVGIASYRLGNTVDAMQLVPRYYRKSAAEEKFEEKFDQ